VVGLPSGKQDSRLPFSAVASNRGHPNPR
jgi:hypothetical protein